MENNEKQVMERKLKYILPGIVIPLFSIVYSTQFDPKLHISGDNAVYLTLARNLSEGHGYSALGTDGEYHPASHFPPGYSFLLSIFMRAGIDSLPFFKLLNGGFLLASLMMWFAMAGGLTRKPLLAFPAVVLAVFSPQTMEFATIAMSEMFYMFLVTAGFYALYRYSRPAYAGHGTPVGSMPHGETSKTVRSGGTGPRRYCFLKDGWFWVAVGSLAAAYYTRSVAMSAIGAALVFFLFRKEWKQAAVYLAGTFALLLPWSLRNASHGIESRYFGTIMTVNPWRPEQGNISSVGEMVEKMIKNFDETVIKGFREILFPFVDLSQGTPSGTFSVICGLAVLAVVFFGAWKMGRMRWAIVAYIVFNIGLFMLWHGGNGSRYVTPIGPLLFLCFYTGLYFLIELVAAKYAAGKTLPSWLPVLFLVMILPSLKPLQTQAEMAKYPYPPHYANYFRIAVELDRQAPPGTVVVARKPDLFNYYAPRLIAVNYKYTTDPLELIAGLVESRASYVVVEQLGYSSTPLYLYPAIRAYPDLFTEIWHLENPDTFLLGFDAGKAANLFAGKGE
ncbi:MAG: hypothetical protein LIO77_00990 [Rikenellaceae bacterium]|nr:hypothetical protein [Rikenellaceae bacterium]